MFGFVCYPWIPGSFAYGPNVVALGPIDRQGRGLLDVAFFKCEVHGDTESPMHPSARLWSFYAMFGQVAIRSLGAVSFKATKIIERPISDKARSAAAALFVLLARRAERSHFPSRRIAFYG